MKLNVSQLLTKLVELAGLKTDSPEFIDLMSSSELTKIEVPESIRTGILNGLMTMETAKNNFDLSSHFKAQALNAVDQKIGAIIDALGLDPTVKAALLEDKNTYNRIDSLSEKLRGKLTELEEAKGSGGSKADKEAIEKFKSEIQDLHAQMKAAETAHTEQITTIHAERAAERLDMAFNTYLAGVNYPAEALKVVSRDTIASEAKGKIRDRLEALGALPVLGESGKITLVQKANPDNPFYLDNEPADFYKISDKTLADAKLVGINNDKNRGGQGGRSGAGGYGRNNGAGGGESPTASTTVEKRIDNQLANLD